MNSAPAEHFYNEGFGWICRKCERIRGEADERRSRLMAEGEAEEKNPELSTGALATWADRSRGILECPACGTTEAIKINR